MSSKNSSDHVYNLRNQSIMNEELPEEVSEEVSEELPEELPVSSTHNDSVQKIIDLTNVLENTQNNPINILENVSIKTEKLNHREFISLIFTLSFIPHMVILMYTFFPKLTLIITIPWIPLLYKMKTHNSKFSIVSNKDYRNMVIITYHHYKESIQEIYSRIENQKDV